MINILLTPVGKRANHTNSVTGISEFYAGRTGYEDKSNGCAAGAFP